VHMKAAFTSVTLVDLSPEMLRMSRRINPDCEHLHGEMRSIRLGRMFDAVFIHDAIDYMTTVGDLRQAVETAFVHLKPGGMALFVRKITSRFA
jgi:trans-aconitate methyltransferase